MCDPIIGGAVIGGALLGSSMYQGAQQRKAMKKAARQAEQQAIADRAAATRENNRLNQKTPDLAGILKRNTTASAGGIGSTMLTGPNGVDMGTIAGSDTLLGRNTLLGA